MWSSTKLHKIELFLITVQFGINNTSMVYFSQSVSSIIGFVMWLVDFTVIQELLDFSSSAAFYALTYCAAKTLNKINWSYSPFHPLDTPKDWGLWTTHNQSAINQSWQYWVLWISYKLLTTFFYSQFQSHVRNRLLRFCLKAASAANINE